MGEWQPIASAPKDGTWLLAIVRGYWATGIPFVPAVVRWGKSSLHDKEGWLHEGEGAEELCYAAFTHWMPLPNPPENPDG